MTSGSPAASAGIKQGDLITAIDGRPISSTQQLIETLGARSPGQAVAVTVRRAGRPLTIKLRLGTRPQTLPTG